MTLSALLEQIDTEIEHARGRLAHLETGREAIAAALASAPVPTPVKAPAARVVAAPPRSRTVETGSRAKTRDQVDAEVLAFLNRQRKPISRAEVIEVINRPASAVVQAVDRLTDSGALVRQGKGRGLRIGTPAVMAAADQEGD